MVCWRGADGFEERRVERRERERKRKRRREASARIVVGVRRPGGEGRVGVGVGGRGFMTGEREGVEEIGRGGRGRGRVEEGDGIVAIGCDRVGCSVWRLSGCLIWGVRRNVCALQGYRIFNRLVNLVLVDVEVDG